VKRSSDPSEAREGRLNALLVHCLELMEAGLPLNLAQLQTRYPEFAGELSEFVAGHEHLEQLAEPFRLSKSATLPHDDTAKGSAGLMEAHRTFDLSGQRFGDFELTKEIGRGGMAVVYQARQLSLNRFVALKMIEVSSLATVKRFRAEAEVVATLDHPNIVPIYEIGGSIEGRPYYVMKLIEGGNLAEWLTARGGQMATRADTRRMAVLMATVAGAVHHAHQHGILHRDLKPSNILLDAQGQPLITDFGLAKEVAKEGGLTQSGAIVGTPGYMAPEQATGRSLGQTSADIFSLGVILYELLTGQRAFRAATPLATLLQVMEHEPERPSKINPQVDADLEAICLKCLEKEAGRRYASAELLAEDLRRWSVGSPVAARRSTAVKRLVKWAKCRPAAAALAAVSLVGAAALLGGAFLFNHQQASAARARAKMEAEARKRLELDYYFRTIALAEREQAAHNAGAAERFLEQCPPDLRGWEWAVLKRLHRAAPPPLRHSSHLFSLAVSPDGRWLIAGGVDGTITQWDSMLAGKPRVIQAHGDQVRGLKFSPDSRTFASAGWDRAVKIWDVQSGACLHAWQVENVAFDVAFLGTGGCQLAASTTREILRWDLATGQQLVSLGGHVDAIRRLASNPDGSELASVDDQGFVKLWVVATGRERLSFRAHPHMIFDVSFSRDGKTLVTAGGQFFMHGDAGEAFLWDAVSGAKLHEFRTNQGAFYAAALSPDGARLLTGGEDALVRVWDVASGQEALRLRGHSEAIWCMAFSPSGERLFTASGDHTVRLWDSAPSSFDADSECLTLEDHHDRFTSVAFSPDGHFLVAASLDGTILIMDAADRRRVRKLSTQIGLVHSIAFSPDGRRLALGIWQRWEAPPASGEIAILDTHTWEIQSRHKLDTVGVLSVAFNRQGTLLAAAADHSTKVLEVSTGKVLWKAPHACLVTAVSFAPEHELAVADADGVVTLCEALTGRTIRRLKAHECRIFSIQFSPNGGLLASAGADGEIHLWDTTDWHDLPRPRGHLGGTHGLAFSPDSRCLVSGGNDGAVRIWDCGAAAELFSLSGHRDTIDTVAICPDGRTIASAGRDGSVRLWRSNPRIKLPVSK
jgi:WD40 repeat protein